MRLLFARVGVPHSPATGLPIESQTVSPDGGPGHGHRAGGTRLYLLAPIVRGRKGEYKRELQDLAEARVPAGQGGRHPLRDRRGAGPRTRRYKHDIEVVVDRLVKVRDGLESRLADSLETALALERRARLRGGGRCGRGRPPPPLDLLGQVRLPRLRLHHRRDRTQALLLQQSLRGLSGLRRTRHRDVLRPRSWSCPDERLSLAQGTIAPWAGSSSPVLPPDPGEPRRALPLRAVGPRSKALPETMSARMLLYGSRTKSR